MTRVEYTPPGEPTPISVVTEEEWNPDRAHDLVDQLNRMICADRGKTLARHARV